MKARILLTVVMSTVLLLVPGAFARGARQDLGDLDRFRQALERDGFDVTPGSVTVLNWAKDWCENKPEVEHAWYTNNEPYLVLQVPESAAKPEVQQQNFKLRPDEAIVLIGLTPPPERYFGFYPFLQTRVVDGERLALMDSLGDAVNNLTVKTIGPTPFNSPVALIFTPDKGTDASVRAALRRAGYPEAIINTVVFPASMLNLGYGETADQLNIKMRNAMWEKPADGDAYINNPPLHLFRVTPQFEGKTNPFRVPRLRIRGTGQTEMDLMNKLGELRARIIEANGGLQAKDYLTMPIGYEGYDYMQHIFVLIGDTRDGFFVGAGYMPEWDSTDQITLADDEFLMLYGVNHVATGKAAYHSINVYTGRKEDGKVSIGSVDDRDFPGTATPYLPDGDPAGNLMYAYKVSRNCGSEPNCLQLSAEDCPRLTIDSDTVLGLMYRMYLEPATKVGAAMPEVLYDRILKFSPRAP
jgi:hypothetical protein